MAGSERYGVEELAALGGVTRRTVRYYVQEGLLPAPLGVGRGRHYGPQHLERLQALRALQERGLSLEEIRRELDRPPGRGARSGGATPAAAEVTRAAWTRLEVAPGIELHVSGQRRLPSPGRLRELVEWCERHIRRNDDD